MKERHWSYLAGLIDGEGTIQINKTKKSFSIRVKIGNTDVRIMHWLIEHFGGVYYTETRSSEKHRVLYQWRIKGSKNTENLLLGLLPYLVIKGEQAKIALRYLGATTTEERQICCDLIKPFNQRGASVTTNTPDCPVNGQMIESDLIGDYESAPTVMLDA